MGCHTVAEEGVPPTRPCRLHTACLSVHVWCVPSTQLPFLEPECLILRTQPAAERTWWPMPYQTSAAVSDLKGQFLSSVKERLLGLFGFYSVLRVCESLWLPDLVRLQAPHGRPWTKLVVVAKTYLMFRVELPCAHPVSPQFLLSQTSIQHSPGVRLIEIFGTVFTLQAECLFVLIKLIENPW